MFMSANAKSFFLIIAIGYSFFVNARPEQFVASELCDENGALWDSEAAYLEDFTDAGYQYGNEPIPNWEGG